MFVRAAFCREEKQKRYEQIKSDWYYSFQMRNKVSGDLRGAKKVNFVPLDNASYFQIRATLDASFPGLIREDDKTWFLPGGQFMGRFFQNMLFSKKIWKLRTFSISNVPI